MKWESERGVPATSVVGVQSKSEFLGFPQARFGRGLAMDRSQVAMTHTGAPRWWVILWMAWGLTLAVLALLRDASPFLAGLWLVGGAFIGLVLPREIGPVLLPLFEWYHKRILSMNRLGRMYELGREQKTQTEVHDELVDDEVFVGTLAAVPLAGLFHGALIGPIVGALWRPYIGMSAAASASAALGLLVGPMLLSALAGITVACVYRPQRTLPLRVQLSRRGLLAISSLLVIPAVWHSLKTLAQRGLRP
jgi:hypothetical protein